MRSIWIVYKDDVAGDPVMGVFDDAVEAENYASKMSVEFPNGLLLTEFPVPWRSGDGSAQIFQ